MIKASAFTGLAPKISPRKLRPTAAQTARDVRLLDGNLTPLKEAESISASVGANTHSFWLYNGTREYWTGELCFVEKVLVNDQYDRVYYTGDGAPKSMSTIATVTTKRALGVPAPTTVHTATVSPKTSLSWTQTWYAFWEETDGTRSSEYTFDPGTEVTTNVVGEQYVLTDGGALPPGGGGTKVLVVWFEGYSSTGVYLGACFPKHSMSAANSDLIVNGAAVNCTNDIGATTVTTDLQYNTSRQTGYNSTRTYVYTWVTDLGEESAPSDPVNIDVSPVQNVDLVLPVDRPYSWVETKRVYRSVTDSSGQTALRLCSFSGTTDLPYDSSNVSDVLLDEELELDTLVTEGFDPPPSDLDCLVAVPGGFLAGASGRTIYFSEPYLPYAWPYSSSIDADIVAMATADNTVVIATTRYPYIATGLTPDGMATAKLPHPMAGTSKKGILAWQGRVLYTSPDGLVEVVGGAVSLVTESIISREYWQALDPSTMRLMAHDDMLLVCCDTITLVFTYADGTMTFTDSALVIDAGYANIDTDQLEIVLHGETAVKSFNTGDPRTMTWRGIDAYYPLPQKMGAYRVQADAYPVTLRVYSDDALVATVSVTQGKAALLPSLPPTKVWSIEIEADTTVYSIETAPTIAGLLR